MSQSLLLKQCSRKENCIHPLGSWLPATTEYFYKHGKGLRGECKKCVLAKQAAKHDPVAIATYGREYRERNREAIAERRAERYQANRETILLQQKRRREANIEYYRERARNYQRANPDAAKRRHKKWYETNRQKAVDNATQWNKAHPDRFSQSANKWRINNPEKSAASVERRRARKMGAEGSYTAEDIRLLLRSQKHKCWWCGEPIEGRKYHVDHRIPLSRGGSNAPENLCISCPHCNVSKHNKLPHEWNGRLL